MNKQEICFIGDSGVGKTNLIEAIAEQPFKPTYQTIAFDLINLDTMRLWDTSGQERFRSYIPSYIKSKHKIVLTYDHTNPDSLKNLGTVWLPLLVNNGISDNTSVMLVGTKFDEFTGDNIEPSILEPLIQGIAKAGFTYGGALNINAQTNYGIGAFKDQVVTIPKAQARLHGDYPPAYEQLWVRNNRQDSKGSVINILDDYTKGNKWYSPIILWAHAHLRRHHTSVVKQAVTDIRSGDDVNTTLESLKVHAEQTDGSLLRRIKFIEDKLCISSVHTSEQQFRL